MDITMFDPLTKEDLYEHLLNQSKVLSTQPLQEAFKKIDRKDFVPEDYKIEAYEDYALPIGYDQTISQPTTVGFMLEQLDVKAGNRVLDLGSGSGWTTALLSVLVGPKGFVQGIERIPELVLFAQTNIDAYDIKNAEIRQASKTLGISKEHYDRILVSAEAKKVPTELLEQLSDGGIMLIPVGDSIIRVLKKSKTKTEEKVFPGFIFVPLIH